VLIGAGAGGEGLISILPPLFVVLLPVAIVGTLLEGGAILAGQGAVIRIVARKAPRAADTPT